MTQVFIFAPPAEIWFVTSVQERSLQICFYLRYNPLNKNLASCFTRNPHSAFSLTQHGNRETVIAFFIFPETWMVSAVVVIKSHSLPILSHHRLYFVGPVTARPEKELLSLISCSEQKNASLVL